VGTLVSDLLAAAKELRSSRMIAGYRKLDLLILDELGFLSVVPDGDQLLFQLCSELHEWVSIIVTTNLRFAEWNTIFKPPSLVWRRHDLGCFSFAHVRTRRLEQGRSPMRMAVTRDETLVQRALLMALRQRQPKTGLLHHVDRGSQFTSHAYRAPLAGWGITFRMSRKGDCHDNAMMESFNATRKGECTDRHA
jgi:hypothetical protein